MTVPLSPASVRALPSRYRIRGVLGEGGSGRVYIVNDVVRETELALKVVTPAESVWLRREFETLRQVRHENLIQVFDWGLLETGASYYTMELIPGGDWGKRMGKPQPSEEVARILKCVLRGLGHLHSHGEIHGDLKPGNVLLGQGGIVKITDVGMGGTSSDIARSGTPGYAAPEIWEGASPTVQSDLYALGVICYEALAGQHPFDGRTIRDVIEGQLAGWVPSLAAHGASVPADLEHALMRALERAPSLREKSVDEFLQILGVDDGVGEVLGGKFVGRINELTRAEGAIPPKPPDSPSVIYVSGPPSVGKTAFLDEVIDRAGRMGVRATRVDGSGLTEIAIAAELPEAHSITSERGVSELAESLWASSRALPRVLCLEIRDESTAVAEIERIRRIGRYLFELAREAGEPNRVILAVELHSQQPQPEDFERAIGLAPLSSSETGTLLQGLLGDSKLEPELVDWLQSSTGGFPGQIAALVTELIERNFLGRRNGTWYFREAERLREFQPRSSSKWEIAWTHLSEDRHTALAILAQTDAGMADGALLLALGASSDPLPDLRAKGWVVQREDRWSLASRDIRQAVLGLADSSLLADARGILLEHCSAHLTREERAAILLEQGASLEAVDEGLWAAELAAARGDYGVAVKRSKASLELSVRLGDTNRGRTASLLLASALHNAGDDNPAAAHVQDERLWRSAGIPPSQSGTREHLLGTIRRAQGDLEAARAHLAKAISISESSDDLKGLLLANAEVAEIEWRQGDETARTVIMEKIRASLERSSGAPNLADEKAALFYQLGAALIIDGRREDAKELLQKGAQLNPGPFWSMRISNALATAFYYLGDFRSALAQMDRAWHFAERGGIDSFKARVLSNRAGVFYGLGRFRDAVDQQGLSAKWARRTGNTFEYLAACSGSSINQTILAQYEQAILQAREARRVAEDLSNYYEIAKNYELESLATFYVGDYETSRKLLEHADEAVEHFGFADVKPRLLWHWARLAALNERLDEAEGLLVEAEEMLQRTKDWEDLPGVQIELQLIRSKQQDPGSCLGAIQQIALRSESAGALLVQLRGALAIGEILVGNRIDDRDHREFLLRGLGMAEQAGAREIGWRLSYLLGELSVAQGDARGATSRFAHALRGLREVAYDLSPHHRELYLATTHARALLDRVSPAA